MLENNSKINGLQQVVASVAVLAGALILGVGIFYAVDQAGKPEIGIEFPGFQGRQDLVVARVNGQEIRLSEVVMARSELPPEVTSLPEALVLETIINDLIDRRLFAEAGWKAGLTRDETVQGQFQFEREKLLRDHYVASMVEEKISERDIKLLYKERYLDVEVLREVHLWQILVRTRAEAREVRGQLRLGLPFEDLARQYSIDAFAVTGGDMGYLGANSLLSEVATRAFFLEEGATSMPFQSSFGWHIIHIQDHRLKEPPPIISVRNILRRELFEAAMYTELERLRAAATIERVSPLQQGELDSALVAAQ